MHNNAKHSARKMPELEMYIRSIKESVIVNTPIPDIAAPVSIGGRKKNAPSRDKASTPAVD